MTALERFSQLANQLQAEEPEFPTAPLPWHSQGYTQDRGYVCTACERVFSDVPSIRLHQAQYCRSYRESERSISTQRMMGG